MALYIKKVYLTSILVYSIKQQLHFNKRQNIKMKLNKILKK